MRHSVLRGFGWCLFLSIASVVCTGVVAQEEKRTPKAKKDSSRRADHQDVVYLTPDGEPLHLDLYLPSLAEDERCPCIVFVHGGGWKNGDKKSGGKNAGWLADHGFAVASINYRLTDVAQWPAQINDCYAAVRWVRENAKNYKIDPSRVGAFGTSAGAHLVALMGTRPCPDPETTSSRVQAVCDWFGPSELLTMPPNNAGDIANSNGAKLLGATVREVPELAKDASGLDNVSADDAAFLIMHGAEDKGVPVNQSAKLHAKLIRSGVPSELAIIEGAGHGGKEFHTPAERKRVLRFFQRTLMPNWSQGSGAGGSFVERNGEAPTAWSVVHNRNIRWRKRLPETGQSTVVCWGNRIFFTTCRPVDEDSTLASDIDAWCCDMNTGETIWKQRIPAAQPLRLSGCFSDSTGPPPVTDGNHVCFFNASGAIACFDMDGKQVWYKEMMAVGRSQPFLVGDDVVFTKQTYMPDNHGHFTHEHKNAPLEKWTQLQALDLATGEPSWNTTCGVNMGSVSLPVTLPSGKQAIVVGRGGGHSPPEKPEGVSMVDATNGTTIWTLPLKKFMSTQTYNVYGDHVLVFHADEHLWVHTETGKIDRQVNIVGDVDLLSHDSEKGQYVRKQANLKSANKSRMIIQQSNVLAGRFHYFRSYNQPWLGRIDVVSGKLEYLELPLQLKRTTNDRKDQLFWAGDEMPADTVEAWKNSQRKPLKKLPLQFTGFAFNDMRNSSGHVVVGDLRSKGNGWGHHASAVPTVVGDYLYVPNMSGTAYVIRHAANQLDENAIKAINDLGPLGESWNRASISFADGKLFVHTIKEVICIQE